MKKRAILSIAGFIIIYLLFRKVMPYYDKKTYGCDLHREVYAMVLKSQITNKLIDVNEHNYPTIYFYNFGSKDKQYIRVYNPEFNYLYDFLEPGDSLIKTKNSLYFIVKSTRLKKDTVIMFSTFCKDSIKQLSREREK